MPPGERRRFSGERVAALRDGDSQLEQRWLGSSIPSCFACRTRLNGHQLGNTRSLTYYRESNAAIYVDGPPHDQPDQMKG